MRQNIDGRAIDRALVCAAGLEQPRIEIIAQILEQQEPARAVRGDDPGRREADGREVARDAHEGGGILAGTGRGVHQDGACPVAVHPFVAPHRGIARQRVARGAGPAGAGEEQVSRGRAVGCVVKCISHGQDPGEGGA